MRIAFITGCLLLSVASVPAFAKAPKADNTAQNRGATESEAVTAEKQGNETSDVTVLSEIRKAIVAEKDLSMDAKNVKVLFSKGLVTLRGPVDSDAEKTKIEELAKQCAGVTSVKNLLTVAKKAH